VGSIAYALGSAGDWVSGDLKAEGGRSGPGWQAVRFLCPQHWSSYRWLGRAFAEDCQARGHFWTEVSEASIEKRPGSWYVLGGIIIYISYHHLPWYWRLASWFGDLLNKLAITAYDCENSICRAKEETSTK
jgi:hypothetical protein